ncbi:phosphatase PAP2 family protein [bacterium]|nr:phosphatase PAP2 family protein [bacterium]
MDNKLEFPILSHFRPADKLIYTYYVVIGFFILIAGAIGRLDKWWLFGLHHLLVILILPIILKYLDSKNGKFFLFLRIFYPLFLFGTMYRETHELDQVIIAKPLDLWFAHWDQILFKCQPFIDFAKNCSGAFFSELMHIGYFSYFILIPLVPLIWWFKNNQEKSEFRFFQLIFLYSIFFSLFIILPVQGPRIQIIEAISMERPGFIFAPFFEWLFRAADIAGAAFPSSHCGIATVVLASAVEDFPKLAPLIGLFVGLLYMATVYGRFHYAVDVAYGVGLGLICFIISPYIYRALLLK